MFFFVGYPRLTMFVLAWVDGDYDLISLRDMDVLIYLRNTMISTVYQPPLYHFIGM